MNFTVTFNHNWSMNDLEKWNVHMDNEEKYWDNLEECAENDDGYFEDYDRNEKNEISLFADLFKRYPNVPLSVLDTVAKIALEEAFERGFNDIIDRWVSYKIMELDIDDEMKKLTHKELSE